MWMSAAQMRLTTVILMLYVKTLMVPTLAAVRRVTLETAEIAQVTRVECQQIQIMIFFLSYGHRGSKWGSFVILPPCDSHLNFSLLFSSVYLVVHLVGFCVFVLFFYFASLEKLSQFAVFLATSSWQPLPSQFFFSLFSQPHPHGGLRGGELRVKVGLRWCRLSIKKEQKSSSLSASNLGTPHCTSSDIDECVQLETNECDAKALCTNTDGSYVCRCQGGYQGDGRNCAGQWVFWYYLPLWLIKSNALLSFP